MFSPDAASNISDLSEKHYHYDKKSRSKKHKKTYHTITIEI